MTNGKEKSPAYCPICGDKTRVIKTTSFPGQVVRLRFCEECGFNYRTKEIFGLPASSRRPQETGRNGVR